MTYRDASIDGIADHGVTPEYVNFSNYDAERGRLMSPTEVAVGTAGRRARRADWRNGCSAPTSIRSTRPFRFEGVHFRVVGVSAKRGTLLGQSQDEFAVIPLGAVSADLRRAAAADDVGQAARPRADRAGDRRYDDRACGLRAA